MTIYKHADIKKIWSLGKTKKTIHYSPISLTIGDYTRPEHIDTL